MLRRLILWLMIFALPLQALAAGSIGHCTTERPDAMSMTMAQHDHASMQMHVDHQHAHQNGQQHHDAGKCSPCCTGAMAATHIAPLALSEATAVFSASPLPTFTSAFLEGRKQPPRPSFA